MSTAAILVNWNGTADTLACIASLDEGTARPNLIIIVDNGSAQHEIDGLRPLEGRSDVRVLYLGKNTGFAFACNHGAEYALNEGCDTLWFLNNDTVVERHCLSKLEQACKAGGGMCAFSARIFFHGGSDIWYDGAVRRRWSKVVSHLTTPSDERSSRDSSTTPFLSGCCIFVSSSTWLAVGGFKEAYIAYSEDNDWSLRAINAGVSLKVIHGALMWHKVSASGRKNYKRLKGIPVQLQYLMIRNNLWTIRRNYGGCERYAALLLSCVAAFKSLVFYTLVMRSHKVAIAHGHGVAKGLFESGIYD